MDEMKYMYHIDQIAEAMNILSLAIAKANEDGFCFCAYLNYYNNEARVQDVNENMRDLATRCGYELETRNRDDDEYNIEHAFEHKGITFYGLDKEGKNA